MYSSSSWMIKKCKTLPATSFIKVVFCFVSNLMQPLPPWSDLIRLWSLHSNQLHRQLDCEFPEVRNRKGLRAVLLWPRCHNFLGQWNQENHWNLFSQIRRWSIIRVLRIPSSQFRNLTNFLFFIWVLICNSLVPDTQRERGANFPVAPQYSPTRPVCFGPPQNYHLFIFYYLPFFPLAFSSNLE